MRRAMRALVVLVVLLLYYCAACNAGDSAGPPSALRAPEPPAAVVAGRSASEISSGATTTPPALEPPTPARPPSARVPPRTLAVSWPNYLGKRVAITCRPIRRIDFTRTLIMAGGNARFIVTGPPDVTPCGATTSMFTVMGSTTLPISGRTVLPELLLEEDGNGEDAAR